MKLMKKIIWLLILVIVVLGSTNVLQYAAARVSTSIYLNSKYKDKDFKFQSFQYDSHFKQYSVTYKDKDGATTDLMVAPKQFPIGIMYDPIFGE